MPHFGGQLRKHPVCGCYRSCSRLQSSSRSLDAVSYTHLTLPTTPSGIIPSYRVLLVTEMFVHFRFEHLLDSSGKQLFQFRLNVSGGSDQQVGLTVCHQQLHQFHLSLV